METQQQTEIVFFDVETTVPNRLGSRHNLLEFGAILVCPRRLVEVGSYSTLICPSDPNSISMTSIRCNGITKETVANAPPFRDVADQVYSILNGRVWAGHNIRRFDCPRIREAFAEIGREAPEAKGMIDTLPLLTQRFGKRAGNMKAYNERIRPLIAMFAEYHKMATLATYFGLGHQKHRSLEDVRMNLEVLKYCATVLFLESSLPGLFSANSLVCENTEIASPNGASPNTMSPNGASPNVISPSDTPCNQKDHKAKSRLQAEAEPSTPLPERDPSDLVVHIEQMNIDPSRRNATETCAPSGYAGFLEPDEVSIDCISASHVPFHCYGNRTLLHKDSPLHICCLGIRVQFGISPKFLDNAGRPKLSIMVNAPENLCQILDFCDRAAQKSSQDSGSSSEWRPVVRKNGYSNSSSIRLHIPTIANGDAAMYSTEIYKKEPSRDNQKITFSKLDVAVLEQLFVPGTIIDAFFSVDVYDFQQNAGIRLVAKKLVVHPM